MLFHFHNASNGNKLSALHAIILSFPYEEKDSLLPNSPMKADKKIRCGNLLLYPIDGASRIAFAVDKAIAHTKGYVKSQ